MQYRLFQREGSDTWYLDVRLPKRYRRSLDTGNREEAEARAKIALDTLALATPTVGYVGLKDALTAVVGTKKNDDTKSSYTAKLRVICKHLPGDGNLLCLTRDDVDRFIAIRREKVKDHTVHKELTLLRQAWSHYVPSAPNPVPSFTARYTPRKRFLTVAEAARLLAVASRAGARTWVWSGLWAGAEPAAIRRMGWVSHDFDLEQVHVLGTKTETRDRFVPLNPEYRERLEDLSRDAPLYHRWRNRHRDFRNWCENAEIDPVCMTDLRRTFGSWLKQAGVDSKTVADLMGHSTTAMVDRVYGQLNAGSLRAAIEKLPRLPLVAL